MGIVTFDEVGVVAVHRPDDVADGSFKRRVEASAEGAGLLDQSEYLITEAGIKVRKHRFHVSDTGHFADLSAFAVYL
ncbi:hypothetical protein [Bradyrhizobium sp. AZCC 1610]|uniref:hypothetical protein n=1 Tax=Bradyrhizobium sp. AZCC 1610 TaxID=3117020 RepID=UPI002FEF6E19